MESLYYYYHKVIGIRPYHVTNRIKWWWQRRRRGFDDSELWNLDHTIAKFILPRLKRFKEICHGYPSELHVDGDGKIGEKRWDEILDKMIISFEAVINMDETILEGKEAYEAANKHHKEGMKLFCEYFGNLWD